MAVLLGASVVVAGGVYSINKYAADATLIRDASGQAESMTSYLAAHMPGIQAVVAGTALGPEAEIFVKRTLSLAGVDAIKLYDQTGRLVYDSNLSHPGGHVEDPLGTHNADALQAITRQASITKLEEEAADGAMELLSETYVPLLREGKVVGAAELYLNQTEKRALFQRGVGWASLLTAALAGFFFSLPTFGFMLRSRQRLAAVKNLEFIASHDALTRLQNREAFLDRLTSTMAHVRAKGGSLALHFIDLDNFKSINDSLGHSAGDELLKAVAARLSTALADGDGLCRFGGDEFLMMQRRGPGMQDPPKDVIGAFFAAFEIGGQSLPVTASIGTCVMAASDSESNAEQLISRADLAVYEAKAAGRNTHKFYVPELSAKLNRRNYVDGETRRALQEKGFELHFQPIVGIKDDRPIGFEALLRLQAADGSTISPAELVPVAEQSGLIDAIGKWVIEDACAKAALWPEHLRVSVNLSVVQFLRRSVVGNVRSALKQSGLAPARLMLEVTESLLISETELALAQLRELRALGVSLAIDDFGSGFSSLGYLANYPFNCLKLDRSFLKALDNGVGNARAVIASIVHLGHALNMEVTVEGVESDVHAALVQTLGCDAGQGYHYARPMPVDQLPGYLLRSTALPLPSSAKLRFPEDIFPRDQSRGASFR